MNVYEYIADNNPKEANYLLSGYGYKKTTSKREISENLKALVRKNKEDGLKDLADIHPDKDLILSLVEDKVTVSSNEQMNFAGVSGQEYVQNLQTDTYWTPNNPKRPIAPDFFYNSDGTPLVDEDKIADKVSEQVKKGIQETELEKLNAEKQKEILKQISLVQQNGNNNQPKKQENGITLTHIVILGSSLFLGYFLYKNLK